jgi:hypothetical protein
MADEPVARRAQGNLSVPSIGGANSGMLEANILSSFTSSDE